VGALKVLVLYNRYRHHVHGEEVVVGNQVQTLRRYGVDALLHTHTSEGLQDSILKRCAAGAASLYNPLSQLRVEKMLASWRPDVLHVHNLYPWISPSALVAATRKRVPVVMTVHHYGLTCPVLTHFRDGKVCTACVGSREFNCVRHNCRGSAIESAVYALRSTIARRFRFFLDRVTVFVALSGFAKEQLVAAGFPRERIAVQPNMIGATQELSEAENRDYVGYVGRITPEKGVDTLCEVALAVGLPLRVAGDASGWPKLVHANQDRVQFVGVLRGERLAQFYRGARFIVVPSRWWEVCPMVVLEAMSHGCPVIGARVGGLPELIEHNSSGLLFEAGDTQTLGKYMRLLWNDRTLRQRLAREANRCLADRFGEQRYVRDLLAIYRQACEGAIVA
jgi:glycosyltransferase involved in cell wall biosynthesis